MNSKYLDKLEYNKILEMLEGFAKTYLGKNLCRRLNPSTNVSFLLEQTNQALGLIYKKGSLPLSSIPNIDIAIKNLESNFSLTASDLLEIGSILKASRELKEYFLDETCDLILPSCDLLYINKLLEKEIFDKILDENTISDNASSKLNSIRKSQKNLGVEIKNKLNSMVHSATYSKYLQDSIVTIKNERYVIPVKEAYRSFVKGFVHDVSSSGSTVFIEPLAVFELNNELNNLKAEEAIEIAKILTELSRKLMPITNELKNNVELIGQIDFIFAKAKYSKKINGICPLINDKKEINLYGARHPLISPEVVVPIDVSLGNNYTSLLITGPNTGGKTVTLKTVGLFCLMACSGILIPARENSSVFVFDNVFADIGDEQSIQESLSTFSSHMVNIIEILKEATSSSLVLLDELGSGTDPVEGASLAISILENLHTLGALTICTTHYPELKKYALTHEGFENASSDFDVEHLRPTYKLLIGIPGKSNAFAISKKLGLSDEILDRAKSFQKDDDINIETLLKNIYDDKLAIEEEKEKIRKNSSQVELLRKSLERDNSKLTQEAKNIVSDAKQKAREILLDAKDEANEIIRELNKESTNTKSANVLRNKLNSSIDTLSHIETDNSVSNSKSLSSEDITVGMEVMCKNFNAKGTVLSLPNRSNEVRVQIGALTTNVKLSDLLLLNTSKKSSLKPSGSAHKHSNVTFSNNKAQNVASEINVIGLTVDQALPIVDKYLDDCYMANLENARIVHGKGTGRLRDGIHSFLKKNPHVKSYRIGTYGEGEMGVTVVSFK